MRQAATHPVSDSYPVAKMARSHVKDAAWVAAEVRVNNVKWRRDTINAMIW